MVRARDRLLRKIADGQLVASKSDSESLPDDPRAHVDGRDRIRDNAANRPRQFGVIPKPEAQPGVLKHGDGPQIFDGRYRVFESIGRGGVAQVFRAEHTVTGRQVALKLLAPGKLDNAELRARFVAEARVTTGIAHPHIVEMLDGGVTEGGQPYVVMELLQGETLSAILRRRRLLPWVEARAIVHQLASGLAHAHSLGVIHRDIKAENVIVGLREDGRPHCKIIDFGLAQFSEAREKNWRKNWKSLAGQPLGTLTTMSPEQFCGRPVSPASDMYALGCLLYRMLTGNYPFAGRDFSELALSHLMVQPTPLPPITHLAECRPGIERVLARCLAKSPRDRWPTMADFLSALNAIESCTKSTSIKQGARPEGRQLRYAAPPASTPKNARDGVGGRRSHGPRKQEIRVLLLLLLAPLLTPEQLTPSEALSSIPAAHVASEAQRLTEASKLRNHSDKGTLCSEAHFKVDAPRSKDSASSFSWLQIPSASSVATTKATEARRFTPPPSASEAPVLVRATPATHRGLKSTVPDSRRFTSVHSELIDPDARHLTVHHYRLRSQRPMRRPMSPVSPNLLVDPDQSQRNPQ